LPSWALSTTDIDVLVEMLQLPPVPYPLDVPSPGVTIDERQRHVAAVRADLTERGLIQGLSPAGDLADALDLLVSGEIVIDGRLAVDQPLDLVGVVRGDHAALAVQTGDKIRISLVRDHDVVPLIVDLLPAMRPLTGNSTTIPYKALTHALTAFMDTGDSVQFKQILTEAGVRSQDVQSLSDLLQVRSVAAQFGVAFRMPATDTYRNRRVWTWYATELAGGALMGHDSNDSPTWTNLIPANPERVGQYLKNALYSLRYASASG
jgi:hypothetical protein